MDETGYGSIADRWNPYDYGSIQRRDYYDLGITPQSQNPATTSRTQRDAAVRGEQLFGQVPEVALNQRDTFAPMHAAAATTAVAPTAPVATLQLPNQQQHWASDTERTIGLAQPNVDVNRFDRALAHPSLQLPDDPSNPDFSDIQRRRAANAGDAAANLYSYYKKNKPELLTPPITNNQSLEYDATGKPIAGNVLHAKLFNDPRFQNLLTTNPQQAHDFYKSVTDRDLTADVKMQGGRTASLQKAEQSMIDDFNKNGGDFDPYTGEPFETRQVADPTSPGSFQTVRTPLSLAKKTALKKAGVFEARTGIKSPQPYDVSSAGAIRPDQQNKLRETMGRLRAKPENTNKTDPEIQLLAQREMFGVAPGTGTGKWARAFNAIDDVTTGLANKVVIDNVNSLLSKSGLDPTGQLHIEPAVPYRNQNRGLNLPNLTGIGDRIKTEAGYVGDYFTAAEQNDPSDPARRTSRSTPFLRDPQMAATPPWY